MSMAANWCGNSHVVRFTRNVFLVDGRLVRKIVVSVRFAEVKEEAAKPTHRGKTTFNAAGGHVAKRAGTTIHPQYKRSGNRRHATKHPSQKAFPWP